VGRASWRWAVAASVVAFLAALPTLAGALPVHAASTPPAELVKRIRASTAVGWSGYAESTGTLVLPDVRELSGLPALLGGTTRMRAWWRGPRDWRVDTLSLTGENDVTRDGDGAWTWESANRGSTRLTGALDIRIPQPSDLLPTALGTRLAGATDVRASALPGRRVAGHDGLGVRLTALRLELTTIRYVDIWAEARTGLPLRVEITPRGASRPAVVTSLLDLSLRRPASASTGFVPPSDSDVRVSDAPDLLARVDKFAPYQLPDRLVGVGRSDLVRATRTAAGLATYGTGVISFAVIPLPPGIARTVIRKLNPAGDGTRGEAGTPLVNAVVAGIGDRSYLLGGTVPVPLLDAALDALRVAPPPYLGERG